MNDDIICKYNTQFVEKPFFYFWSTKYKVGVVTSDYYEIAIIALQSSLSCEICYFVGNFKFF